MGRPRAFSAEYTHSAGKVPGCKEQIGLLLEVGDEALLLDSARIAPMGTQEDGAAMAARSRLRRERLVAHRASGHADAEAWDLDFWQSQSPEDRLSALVAIRRDVEAVAAGRKSGHD
jgi:hypothetical protein